MAEDDSFMNVISEVLATEPDIEKATDKLMKLAKELGIVQPIKETCQDKSQLWCVGDDCD